MSKNIIILPKKYKMNGLKTVFLIVISIFFSSIVDAQVIKGRITSNDKPVSFANVVLKGSGLGVAASHDGVYSIENVPLGYQYIEVTAIGMVRKELYVDVKEGISVINISIEPSIYDLDQVVVTGTKTSKRRKSSPVIVDVIDSEKLQSVQACNLAEGLNFQPAVRVETDCQTCNYTQLRMNGLPGGYSQILINGRSIFSPLTGLYGMEQIPINMIERVEIVRGGGSSLYGSSAIGGVVNLITKLPLKSGFSFGYDYAKVNKVIDDKVFRGNSTVLNKARKSGATFFVNNRDRMAYDHNGDNYSELPALKDNTFGANLFFIPSEGQKIEVNMGSLYEYRYGGEMIDGAAHLAMQSEERVHNILLGNLDYQIDFNNLTSLISYVAAQKTEREHYTGVRPDIGTNDDIEHLANPAYGNSLSVTKQVGLQLNHNYDKLLGNNILTIGSEFISDNVIDKIDTYNHLVDQKVRAYALFFQSDWNLTERFNLLTGTRFDGHSMLSDIVISPRLSLLYALKKNIQFRMSYATGFRAPQAFDSDLHMAFAGGGISRIDLAEDLKEEYSKSVTASLAYDRLIDYFLYGITIQGFYTNLINTFYYDPLGEDSFGKIFIKRNGDGATVRGLNLDFRFNFNQKFQIESGMTLQESLFDELVVYSDNLKGKREFLRSPNEYGYIALDYLLSSRFRFSTNLVHTGKMDLLHMAGSPEQPTDQYITSKVFNAIGLKATYVQKLEIVGSELEYGFGVKNLTNDYQDDFDTLKNRDSNFVYGPSTPRTIYFSLTLKSL